MKSGSKIVLIIGLILFSIGLVIVLISFIMGARYTEVNYIIENSGVEKYYHRSNNNELDNDALIWENSMNDLAVVDYNFPVQQVTSLNISIDAAEVMIQTGNDYSVKGINIEPDSLYCKLTSSGQLKIDNRKEHFGFWNIFRPRRYAMNQKIVITIPENINLESLIIELGAGELVGKNLNLTANNGEIKVGAGELILSELKLKNGNIDCGVGSIQISGTMEGKTKVHCGVGDIKLDLKGDIDSYSYSAEVGLGEVSINRETISGLGQKVSTGHKENHFILNCGIGEISIYVQR